MTFCNRNAHIAFLPGSRAARGDQSGMWGTTAGQRFGVRSYLHLFYEDCAFSQPEEDPEEPEGTLSSCASSHPLLWRASLTTGILVLLMGVAALGTGLLVPPKIEGFGEGELQVVDQQAIEYNQALERCALAGGILLTLGGTALLACALICPLCRVLDKPKGEDAQHLLPRTGGHLEPRSRATVPTVSSLDSRLPVSLTHMQNIQPRPRS
ncbi:neurensin-1-like [Acipenser oxyrinchus oxyrinchus]|uniref:Neurensin-1-like n=1 Tax=Acipenser oxyrinchus oxyrinchus TaxID=40147 RepID=A0AAD8CS93_ACIOX|nr:neurensin-1-like [Acipenser oxyrinchus oxyrinchus]